MDINEVMENYQILVDNDIVSLEEAQSSFDDILINYINDVKKDIDRAYDDRIITAYEKDIMYINIGLDAPESYTDVISNLIESELSKPDITDNVFIERLVSKEEYDQMMLAKQQKAAKRKMLLKKVGKIAGGAALVGAAAVGLSALDKNSNNKAVVREDNPEYSEMFSKKKKNIAAEEARHKKAMRHAKTNIEREDLERQHRSNMKSINDNFNNEVSAYQTQKKQTYDRERNEDNRLYADKMKTETDPEKIARYKDAHKYNQDIYNYDKENREKAKAYNRSDYHMQTELNNAKKGIMGKLFYKGREKRIRARYANYNKNNIG
jgi:hypothetical protein